MEYNRGQFIHADAIALNCGRRAFSYIIQTHRINKIWVPRLTCDSVIEPFVKAHSEINYYGVSEELRPLIDDIPCEDWIVIINYYGQLSDDEIIDLQREHPNIIIDNSQDYFRNPIPDLNTIYSCRKYFGVSDGAFLYTDKELKADIEVDKSYDHMDFLLGRFECSASMFYESYNQNNSRFDNEPVKRMSKLTQNILRGIDYDYVKKRRTENFEYLANHFDRINQLNPVVPEGAYMYPLFLSNGVEIRKRLIERKIYVPVLWPDVLKRNPETDIVVDLANNILPLPIDQRYEIKDMEYLVEEVLKCSCHARF